MFKKTIKVSNEVEVEVELEFLECVQQYFNLPHVKNINVEHIKQFVFQRTTKQIQLAATG